MIINKNQKEMIDTIKGYQDLSDNPKLISFLETRIDNPKYLANHDSQTGYLKGYIDNFKISIRYSLSNHSPNQLNFEGSIPKFLYGNNLSICTPADIELVINALSDVLEIPLDNAKITRLDFGLNFIVKHPVSNYTQAIQGYPRMKRVLYDGESVSFRIKSNTKEISFYDKITEMKKDKKSRQALSSVPDHIKDLNILRYELKSLKGFSLIPRLKNMSFIDASSPETFEYLYDVLVSTLSKVNIVDFDIPSNSFVFSKGWLKNFLAMIGLKSYGLNEAFNLIDSQEYDVKNPGVKRSTLKRSIRELASQYNNLHATSIKRELESKLGALYGILL